MPRADVDDVLATFDADIKPSAVAQWLRQASYVVDDVAQASPRVEDDQLKDIEILVAQHFLAAQKPRFRSQEGPSRSGSYGEGRGDTAYLDRAKRIDPTGKVAASVEQEDFIFNG